MDNQIKTWLYDILKSIEEIESYFEDQVITSDKSHADVKTKRAIERGLEIIGEATNRILNKIKVFKSRMLIKLSALET
jgi:uncharacterized protein with HEPN domain